MKIRLLAPILTLALLSIPRAAHAAGTPCCDGTTYGDQAVDKLKHGVGNTLLGWTALFREPIRAGKSGGNVLAGLGHGVWQAVGQTVGGAAQIVTFPLPKVHVPIPESDSPRTAEHAS